MITEAHKPHHLPYNNIHLIIHEVTQQIIASIFYLKKKKWNPPNPIVASLYITYENYVLNYLENP